MRAKSTIIETDGAGAATVTVGMPTCKLRGIFIDNPAAGGATGGTVDVANMGRECVNGINPSTDSYTPVREQGESAAGAGLADEYTDFIVHGPLTVAVAGAGANRTFTIVWLYE